MRVATESSANQTIDLPLGEVMEIRLAENPTTGFSWQLAEQGHPACAMVKDAFEPQAGAPGQGGEHAWQFQAMQPGDCDISLVYRRKWETSTPPARSFTLHVHVAQ